MKKLYKNLIVQNVLYLMELSYFVIFVNMLLFQKIFADMSLYMIQNVKLDYSGYRGYYVFGPERPI